MTVSTSLSTNPSTSSPTAFVTFPAIPLRMPSIPLRILSPIPLTLVPVAVDPEMPEVVLVAIDEPIDPKNDVISEGLGNNPGSGSGAGVGAGNASLTKTCFPIASGATSLTSTSVTSTPLMATTSSVKTSRRPRIPPRVPAPAEFVEFAG